MKKFLAVAVVALMLAFVAGTVYAESIENRLGVTGRMGFIIPADSDFNDFQIDMDAGFIGGGGVIYGFDRNIALEFDVTHTWFDGERPSGFDMGEFSITNLAFGAQYRFVVNEPALTPYAGAGIDVLLNDYSGGSVDDTLGIHVSGGVDYFLTRQIALNAEVKAVAAPDADIEGGGAGGNFDPSSISGTFGIRYFF